MRLNVGREKDQENKFNVADMRFWGCCIRWLDTLDKIGLKMNVLEKKLDSTYFEKDGRKLP